MLFTLCIATLLIPSKAKSVVSHKLDKFKSSFNINDTKGAYFYFLNGELFDIGTLDNKGVIVHGVYLLNRHQTRQFSNIKMSKNDQAIFITTKGSVKGKAVDVKIAKMKLQNITTAVKRINEGLKQHAEDLAL